MYNLTPTQARVALLKNEQTVQHMRIAKHYRVDGKRYKEEIRKVNRKVDRRVNALLRKAKSSE